MHENLFFPNLGTTGSATVVLIYYYLEKVKLKIHTKKEDISALHG